MIFYLTQISRISRKAALLCSRLAAVPSACSPEGHTSDSDVCFCEIREICVR